MNTEAQEWYMLSIEEFEVGSYSDAYLKFKKCISLLTEKLSKEEFQWLLRIYTYNLYHDLANKLYTMGHYEDALFYFQELDYNKAPDVIKERLRISKLRIIHPKEYKGKWGYANKSGEFEIAPFYDKAEIFHDGHAYVRINNRLGLINRKGIRIVGAIYDNIFFDDSLQHMDQLIPVLRGRKYGYVNKKRIGKIRPQFDYAWLFKHGIAAVKIGDKYGFINEQNESVIPFIYDKVYYDESSFIIVEKNGKQGYLDFEGNERIFMQFEDARLFSEDLAIVKKTGRYGIIDMEGHQIIPFMYDFIHGIYGGMKYVASANRTYFINNQNTIIYECT